MALPAIGAAIAAAAPAIQTAADSALAIGNYNAQRKAYNFQKTTYYNSLMREDTAVRRRMHDLTAAGLSPTLAAGSAATTQGTFNGSPPQAKGVDLMNTMMGQKQLVLADKQAALTDANINKLHSETEGIKLDNLKKTTFNIEYEDRLKAELESTLAGVSNKDANTIRAAVNAAIDQHNLDIFDSWNLPTTTRAKVTEILSGVNAAQTLENQTNIQAKKIDNFAVKALEQNQARAAERKAAEDSKKWQPGETEAAYIYRLQKMGFTKPEIGAILKPYKQ